MVSRDAIDGKFEIQLQEDMAQFYADPLGWVMYSFDWDNDPAIQVVDWYDEHTLVDPETHEMYDLRRDKNHIPESAGHLITYKEFMTPWREMFPGCQFGPDHWACEFLDDLGKEIRSRGFDGRNAVDPIRFSTVSGHGIGKSTIVAWLILFIMSTRPYSKGVVTAGTIDQLKTKTWAELGKWHRKCITGHWFDYSAGRGTMALVHKQYRADWRCDAQTSKEENSEAFAGLHAANSTSFYIFDEASGVNDKVYQVREGGATDGEHMRFDFGNGTKNAGYFYENCVGKFAHRYKVREIDSRTVKITNKNMFYEWILDYGIDNDFVRVRVRGMFPVADSVQFMSVEEVRNGMMVSLPTQTLKDHSPLTIGVDIARQGPDATVIYPRMGKDARSWEPRILRGADTNKVIQEIIDMIRHFEGLGVPCSGLFIDEGNTGGAVIDVLRNLGYEPIAVSFGKTAHNNRKYRYVVDEIWGKLRDDIRNGLALPAENTRAGGHLLQDLTQREYGYTLRTELIALEAKKDMKERGLESPDVTDALACTYFLEVATRKIKQQLPSHSAQRQKQIDYDPTEIQL